MQQHKSKCRFLQNQDQNWLKCEFVEVKIMESLPVNKINVQCSFENKVTVVLPCFVKAGRFSAEVWMQQWQKLLWNEGILQLVEAASHDAELVS